MEEDKVRISIRLEVSLLNALQTAADQAKPATSREAMAGYLLELGLNAYNQRASIINDARQTGLALAKRKR